MHYRTTEPQDLCPTTQLLDLDGVLRRCHARVQLVLLSNATSRLSDDLRGLGLLDLFDGIVGTGALGVAKPDARAFQAALRRTGAVAARTLCVDDSAANVQAAATLDMHTHLFHAAAGLQEHMEDLGMLGEEENTARP